MQSLSQYTIICNGANALAIDAHNAQCTRMSNGNIPADEFCQVYQKPGQLRLDQKAAPVDQGYPHLAQ